MSILALQNPKDFSRQHLIHLHCTLGREERRGGGLAVMVKKELWLRSKEPMWSLTCGVTLYKSFPFFGPHSIYL